MGLEAEGVRGMQPTTGRIAQDPEHAADGRAGLRGHVGRYFTAPGTHPYDSVRWERRDSRIANPDGSAVFEMRGVEVPAGWSQLATDIVASKYFRKAGVPGTGGEMSVKQLVHRVAHTIRTAGEAQGVLGAAEEAQAFEDELTYMLVHQIGAFNSPVWFNCGLLHDYAIAGRAVGNWYWDRAAAEVRETFDAYSHPQLSACFIQSIDDDLMDIADAVRREMRIFKFGSGTGTNYSRIRAEGERLSGGGTSSGLMSFLEILDRAAGATKSGGTTRRAAKMVCLDMDHPDISRFINWKMREEEKARILIESGLSADFNGEAYRTVGGQNSNNSVRIADDFMVADREGREWRTRWRTSDAPGPAFPARDLMDQIARAAWSCADPGVQFDTTINRWHTCKNSGPIRASNPCSEFMYLDDTACNLSSINLVKFYDSEARRFDVNGFRHAVEVFLTAMEIIVDLASYPTQKIARNSHDHRPLGLGYANLGTLLMLMGLAYDSDAGRTVAGALTAIMSGRAYACSAQLAAQVGPFAAYAKNEKPMLDVIGMHRDAADRLGAGAGDGEAPDRAELIAAARFDWERALELGRLHGYRNSQATVLAPTGTIGLLMDCDTTGVEPEFAQVKYKKLAGGGYFKLVNQSIPLALSNLGYAPEAVARITRYLIGSQTLVGAPHVNRDSLAARGVSAADLQAIEESLPQAMDLSSVSAVVPGDPSGTRLSGRALLRRLGFADGEIEAAEREICGRMTVEGAPGLRNEHLSVFDCANRCGRDGVRFIHHMGHIRMMAAVQPFISGAISKTINMPNEVTVADVREAYVTAWQLGIKAVALYRDGCKGSQPLSTRGEGEAVAVAPATVVAAPVVAPTPAVAPRDRAPKRRRLPLKRAGFTQECKVGGHKLYLRTGEYADGEVGEIFIDMHKEGAAFRSMMNCFAISVSLGLQYGVPLEEYVDCFTFTRFEPHGPTNHPNVRYATSVIDFVFRVLGLEYLGRTDFVQVPPADGLEEGLVAHKPGGPATGEVASTAVPVVPVAPTAHAVVDHRSKQLASLMGDAPFCDQCGSLTVRNGACYRCENCGASLGCS